MPSSQHHRQHAQSRLQYGSEWQQHVTGAHLRGGVIRPVCKPPVQLQFAERHQLPIDPLHTAPKHGEGTPHFGLGLGWALCEGLDLARLAEALKYVLGAGVEGFLEVQRVAVACLLGGCLWFGFGR